MTKKIFLKAMSIMSVILVVVMLAMLTYPFYNLLNIVSVPNTTKSDMLALMSKDFKWFIIPLAIWFVINGIKYIIKPKE